MPENVMKIIADHHTAIKDKTSLEKKVGHWPEWPLSAEEIVDLCISYQWPNEKFWVELSKRQLQKAKEG